MVVIAEGRGPATVTAIEAGAAVGVVAEVAGGDAAAVEGSPERVSGTVAASPPLPPACDPEARL